MPYLANIDGIIWLVIIVVSIIAQIVKASKKAAAKAPQTDSPRSPTQGERQETVTGARRTSAPQKKTYRDRSDELRQFFETLGVPTQELAPAAKKRKRQKPVATPPAPPPVAMRKAPPPRDTESVKLETFDTVESRQTRELRERLRQKSTQRQAILLREILGPPLALR